MIFEDINKLAIENSNFRKVIYTTKNSQLVLMSIPSGEDIGEEVHQNTDQIIYIIQGEAEVQLNGETRLLGENDVVFVPTGKTHNLKNLGKKDLKLFTIYSPPNHQDGTIHKTKKEAEEAERR